MKEIFDGDLINDLRNKENEVSSLISSSDRQLYKVWDPFFELIWKYLRTKKKWENWSVYRFNGFTFKSPDGPRFNFTTYGFQIKKRFKRILYIEKYSGMFGIRDFFSKFEVDEKYLEELKKIYNDIYIEMNSSIEKERNSAQIKKIYTDLTWGKM